MKQLNLCSAMEQASIYPQEGLRPFKVLADMVKRAFNIPPGTHKTETGFRKITVKIYLEVCHILKVPRKM